MPHPKGKSSSPPIPRPSQDPPASPILKTSAQEKNLKRKGVTFSLGIKAEVEIMQKSTSKSKSKSDSKRPAKSETKANKSSSSKNRASQAASSPSGAVSPNTSGSGYVRLQGGYQSAGWHKYDANVPTADFLAADQNQQAALINAMLTSQNDSAAYSRTNRRLPVHSGGRITELDDDQPPTSKALTAANLKRASSNATSHMSNSHHGTLTSVSRRPPRSSSSSCDDPELSEAPSSSAAPPRASSRLQIEGAPAKCSKCGELKRSGVQNIKLVRGNVQICMACLARLEGDGAVSTWMAGLKV